MRRYRIESAIYNDLGSATIATPDDGGDWTRADEALAVEAERDQLRARVADLEAEVERLKSAPIPATLKPGWKMPDAPVCHVCGRPREPVAVRDADGWAMAWSDWCSPCKASLDDVEGPDWPFVEDYATADDFSALGFAVEVA